MLYDLATQLVLIPAISPDTGRLEVGGLLKVQRTGFWGDLYVYLGEKTVASG